MTIVQNEQLKRLQKWRSSMWITIFEYNFTMSIPETIYMGWMNVNELHLFPTDIFLPSYFSSKREKERERGRRVVAQTYEHK